MCGTGYVKKPDPRTISCGGAAAMCTDALCCDATCAVHPCANGFYSRASAAADSCGGPVAMCTNAACCVQVTGVPDTPIPPTAAPTQAPPTDAPPTNAPPTNAPPTDAPPTNAPPTNVPPTNAPDTPAPPTSVPATSVPDTATPTGAPATPAPPTNVPQETAAPATAVPETTVPVTEQPAASASPTAMPTATPTALPTAAPTPNPPGTTAAPTALPPTAGPTPVPAVQAADTAAPTAAPPEKLVPESTQDVAAAGAAIGGLVGGPGAAGAGMRMLLLSQNCADDGGEKQLSWFFHPTRIKLQGSEAAGAIVGNTLIIALFTVLATVLAELMKRCVSSSSMERLGASDAYGLICFPSAPLFLLQWFYQGTTMSGMILAAHPPSTGAFFLGAVTTLVAFAIPLYVLSLIVKAVPAHAFYQEDPLERGRVLSFIVGPGEWLSRSSELHFVQRYASVLRMYTQRCVCHQFCAWHARTHTHTHTHRHGTPSQSLAQAWASPALLQFRR